MKKLISLLLLLTLTASVQAYDDDPDPVEYALKVNAVICGHFGPITGEGCGIFFEYYDNDFREAVIFTNPKAVAELSEIASEIEEDGLGSYGNCGKKIKTGAQIGELKSFDSSYFYKTSDVESFRWDCFFRF